MKKILRLFLIIFVVFTLTACQDDKVLNKAFQELTIDADLNNVTGNLDLITQIGDVSIEWKSSNEGVITPEGKVRLRDGKRVVKLTAILTYKGKTKTKLFEVTVPPKTADPDKPEDPNNPGDENEQLKRDYKKWLNERLSFTYVTHDLSLPTTHPVLGGVVHWETTNENIITSDGRVNQSQNKQEVTLTANIKHGNSDFSVEFNFVVLGTEVSSQIDAISVVRNKPIGSTVTTLGVVTEVVANNAYIQDNTGAIYLYFGRDASFTDDLEEGNLIQVSGTLDQFNGLIEIKSVQSVEVILTAVQQPEVIELQNFSRTSLSNLESRKVAFIDATITELPSIIKSGVDNFIELSDGKENIKIFISQHLESSIIERLNYKLKWFSVGEKISLSGVMVGNYNGYQFVLTTDDNIIDKDLTTEEKYEVVIDSLRSILSLDGTSIYHQINFVKNSVYDSKITYKSTHPHILDVGVFEPQDIDTVVTIKFIVEIDGQTFPEESIMLTVKAKGQTVDPIENLNAYYKTAEGLSGTTLRNQLNTIISSNVRSISYKETSYILDETDADPKNNKNVLLIYNRASVSGIWNGTTWNKEHVWPQSKLGSASKSDLHNLRPANPTINSRRGNLPFADGSGSYGTVSGGWFPGEDDKGDVARIILYMNVRWNLEITKGGIGDLKTFLKWHLDDPVDDFERNRNNIIFENQKNRNPFIDYPEFVELIWGPSIQNTLLEFGIYNNYVFIKSKFIDVLDNFTDQQAQLVVNNPILVDTYAIIKSREKYI